MRFRQATALLICLVLTTGAFGIQRDDPRTPRWWGQLIRTVRHIIVQPFDNLLTVPHP